MPKVKAVVPILRHAAPWRSPCIALVLAVAAVLVAALAVPGPSRAAIAGTSPASVQLKTLSVSGGVLLASGAERIAAQAHAAQAQSDAGADGQGGTITLDAGRRFTMAGLMCDQPAASGQIVVRLRTSLDGLCWSRWYEAELEREGDGGAAPRSFTEALWTGAARYVQLSAQAEAVSAPVTLQDARLIAIDSVPAGNVDAAGGASRLATEAVADGWTDAQLAAGEPAAPPTIVTRKAWGADESLRGSAPSYATVKMAFIHHTAGGNDYTRADAPAIVRGIYAYHTKGLGWNDVGYNFLIDRFGTVYEGRYGGAAKGVVGAQVLGFNRGSTGISMMGTYSSAALPATAAEALESLLAWKLSLTGLKPLGTAKMTCGSAEKFKAGATVTLPVIAGHRDANYTECPGINLYALLPTVRAKVASLIDPVPWSVTLSLSAATAPAGSTVTYSGSVTSSTGSPGAGVVTIQRRSASGGSWIDWRTGTLADGGSYSISVKMTSVGSWQLRALMPDSGGSLAGHSDIKELTITRALAPKWQVTLSLSPASVTVNQSVTFRGVVTTAAGVAGSGVVTLQKRPSSGGDWIAWRTAVLGRGGGFSISVPMVQAQTSSIRARMPGDADNRAGFSPTKRLTVL
jgi:hypothetical protein